MRLTNSFFKYIAIFVCLTLSASVSYSQSKVVILPFVNEQAEQSTLDLITDFIWQELSLVGDFTIPTVPTVQSTLIAQGFMSTECFDMQCAVRYGRILESRAAVIGKLMVRGHVTQLTVQVVDVPESGVLFSTSIDSDTPDDIFLKIGNLTHEILKALTERDPVASPVQPVPETRRIESPPVAVQEIRILHDPVQSMPAGYSLPVQAQVQPRIGNGRLFLLYRNTGEARFQLLRMTMVIADEYYGEIPANVTNREMEYYLSVVDDDGAEIGRYPSGTSTIRVFPSSVGQTVHPTPVPSTAPTETGPAVTAPVREQEQVSGKRTSSRPQIALYAGYGISLFDEIDFVDQANYIPFGVQVLFGDRIQFGGEFNHAIVPFMFEFAMDGQTYGDLIVNQTVIGGIVRVNFGSGRSQRYIRGGVGLYSGNQKFDVDDDLIEQVGLESFTLEMESAVGYNIGIGISSRGRTAYFMETVYHGVSRKLKDMDTDAAHMHNLAVHVGIQFRL